LDDHQAADAAGISRQTGSKWWRRAKAGEFADQSSAPHRPAIHHGSDVVAALCARRRELRVGPHILAWEASLAPSTAYAILRRHDLGRLDRLEPRPPIVRYERARPGELVHLDTKQLGRIPAGGGLAPARRASGYRPSGAGWNRVHLAIDDHSRLAYVEELPDELPATTAGFPAERGTSMRRMASGSSGSSPTTAARTSVAYSPRRTAKPSGSFGPSLPSGPMPVRSGTPPSGSPASLGLSTSTITVDHIGHSPARPPISRLPVNNLYG
jgi:hypothetical protein